jgi:type III pantothenate kinase
MQIAVDIGNSRIKVGTFEGKELLHDFIFEAMDEFLAWIQTQTFNYSIVCSVRNSTNLYDLPINFNYHLTSELPIPVLNEYKTPKTLGMDRLAAIVGARELFPDRAALVIDAGTCVTYDFVSQSGHYLGGIISPGFEMRLKAMNVFTDALPVVSPFSDANLIGQSTETCMQSGALNGLIAEADGLIQQFKNLYGPLEVIICGGNSILFDRKLQNSIFVVPKIVLIGLNSILLYNESIQKN